MNERTLRDPWLIAAWPGLGAVAVIAASYLIRSVGARQVKGLSGAAYFEQQHVSVHDGIAATAPAPGGLFYEWRNPGEGRDLLVFLGEAQPRSGGARWCRDILDYARQRGARRLVTFAALGTQLQPGHAAHVHAVATDRAILEEILDVGAAPLKEGQIGGLNGVLLGVGEREGFGGACLMAEIPYFAGGVPNPKAALAALEVLQSFADIEIQLEPLARQAAEVDRQLVELFDRLRAGAEEDEETPEEIDLADETDDEPDPQAAERLDYATRARLEQMFEAARRNRERAFELKKELDRLGVFGQYEDRFLDLFKRAE